MRCPHCNHQFELPQPPKELWELGYMVGKGWLFRGLLRNNLWKTDADILEWLEKGWVEMHPELGFRITPLGTSACQTPV